MATLAGAKNWVSNPSFETNLTGWSKGSGISTFIRVDNEEWVGDYCCKITKSGANAYLTMSAAARVAVQTQDDCYYAVRIKAASASHTAVIYSLFYDSGGSNVRFTDHGEVTLSTGWTTLTGYDRTQAGEVSTAIYIKFGAAMADGTDLWIDGAEIRKNQPLDTYIDGDQGSIYSWNGTAHASTSNRADVTAQEVIGTGGVINMTAKLYRSNKKAQLLENISEDLIEGEVRFDEQNEIHMAFKAKIRDITELDAYSDWVVPVLRLQYAGGSITEERLGHFIVVPATRRYSQGSTEGDIDGRDATWLLTIDEFSKGYSIGAGNDFCLEVRNILRAMDMPLVSIPNSGKTVPRKRTWEPGTKKLKVVNDLLDSAGFYPLHATRDGYLRSFQMLNLHDAEPDVFYSSSTTASQLRGITGVVIETPDMENFANRMVVVAEDAERNTIRVIERNDNTASPVSIPRLGITKTKTHVSKNINNATDARELCKRMLERAARHLVKLEINTVPDPRRNPYEVYLLQIDQSDGTNVATGKYACTGWTIGFKPNQGAMKHSVERLQIYQ